MRRWWAALIVCSACDNTQAARDVAAIAPTSEGAAAVAAAPAASAPMVVSQAPAPPPSATEKPGAKRRFKDAVVYLDGRPLAALRYGEMSPTVEPKFLGESKFPRFRVAQYLESVGVDLAKVRELHLYGGRRVAIVSGEELRKKQEVLLFAFNQATRGKPRMEWPTDGGIEVSTKIDGISSIAVYQDKTAPTIMQSRRGPYLAFEQGKPLDVIPYAPLEKILQGTRSYVDGKLVATVKRKTIPETFVIPGTSPTRFRLVPYLESLGVDFRGARAVDLIQGDDTLARIDGKKWAELSSTLDFTLGQGSQGNVLIDLKPLRTELADASAGKRAKVSGVIVYRKLAPPERKLLDLADLASEEETLTWDPSAAGEDS